MMNKPVIKSSFILIQLIMMAVLFYPSVASASIGKVIYGYGNNHAYDRDGNRRNLSKGSALEEGDTLVTGYGRMQIRFIDGGFVSIYPNSEYKIEQYSFTAKNNKKETLKKAASSKENKGFFSLLKGAARQVTGLLGRNNRENFKFKTTVATIGIRGTGFLVRLCQADCFDADGNPMQDGMYVKNNTGIITVTNNAGDVALAQGQSAFAPSTEDAPQQIVQPPVAYNVVTPDIEQFDFDEKPLADFIDRRVNVRKLEYAANGLPRRINILDTDKATDGLKQNGDAIEHFEALIIDQIPVIFDKGTAKLVESGKSASLGVLWNRWSGNYTYQESGNDVVSLDQQLHLIGSESPTASLPNSGIINYTSVGGTSPTFSGVTGNQVGTQTVTATIDYNKLTVNALDINATFSDAVISASLPAITAHPITASSGNIYSMTGSCTGAGCGPNGGAVSGDASINLVGAHAEGIYGSYSLSSGTGENATAGSYFATDTALTATP